MLKVIKPALTTVEIGITYRCNVKCNNCSSLCTQAPGYFDMMPGQLAKFLAQSVACDYPWRVITIHGGEPALHPLFLHMCELLYSYQQNNNPHCAIWCLTNWSHPTIRERIKEMQSRFGFGIGSAEKQGDNSNPNGVRMEYIPVNVAPVDLGIQHTHGCHIVETCGMYFNYAGLFPCSVSAAMHRVFDVKPMCDHVSELSETVVNDSLTYTCSICGFAVPDVKRVYEQQTSSTWESALREYKERHGIK